jgi:hypothetical protein
LRKIGQMQALDITNEITELREIKDIQDELSIISMIFQDHEKFISTLDSIVGSLQAI